MIKSFGRFLVRQSRVTGDPVDLGASRGLVVKEVHLILSKPYPFRKTITYQTQTNSLSMNKYTKHHLKFQQKTSAKA